MNPTPISRLRAALACACLAAAPLLAAEPAPVTERGDLWQVTTQMSMEGMDMALPSQTNTVCSDKGWSRPPVGGNDRGCRIQNVTNTPSKTTWKMSCSGPPAMSGDGEITRSGPDDYAGSMKLSGPDGVFKMKLTGHKIGECDGAAVRKERADTIARVQAQSDAAVAMQAENMASLCNGVADALDLMTLTTPNGPCADPAYKTKFCTKFQTRDGLEALAGRPAPYGVEAGASYCGVDVAALKQKYCAEAVQKQDYEYLAKACPADVEAIAKKECAGRDGTTFYATPLGHLCATYANQTMINEQAKPETKKDKTKKMLKGIFP